MGTGPDLVRTERLCLGVEEVGSNPPPGEESKGRLSPTSSPTGIPPKNTPPPTVRTPSHAMVVDREERGPGERGAGRTDPTGSERPPGLRQLLKGLVGFLQFGKPAPGVLRNSGREAFLLRKKGEMVRERDLDTHSHRR